MVKQLRTHNLYLFLIHAAFLVFFLLNRVYFMTYVNIISVTLYLINFYLFEKEKYKVVFNIIYFEIIVHSFLGIMVLGSKSGLSMLSLAVIPIIFYYDRILRNYNYDGIRYKEYLGFLGGLILFGEVWSCFMPPLYIVSESVYDMLRLASYLMIFIDFCFILTKYTVTVRSSEERLKEQKGILERVSRQDSLTGMENRRSIMEYFTEAMALKEQFAVIMIDIDFFKQVNDTYGHECGDFALVKVTGIINQCVRKCDIVSRWGGEEILIYLPGCDIADAEIIAERIRSTVAAETFVYNDKKFGITVTLGAEVSDGHDSIESIIRTADERLYRGKTSGRNKVVSR